MIQTFVTRQWFLLALAVVLAVGFTLSPTLAPLAASLREAWIVAGVLFLMALPVDSSSMWQAVRYPTAVLLATTIGYALAPFLAWLVAPWLRSDFASGLLIAACIPTTLASAAVWTRRAGGNDAIAVLVTMLMNFTCFLATPWLLRATTGTQVEIDVGQMTQKLAMAVVLPMFIAQCLRRSPGVAEFAKRRKAALGILAQCGILSIVFIGSVTGGIALRKQWLADGSPHADPGAALGFTAFLAMLCGVVLVHLLTLAAGHGLGRACRLSRPDRIAVGFSGSQKTLAVGLYLSQLYFPGLALLPLITYHVVQLLIDAIVADWLKLRSSRKAES